MREYPETHHNPENFVSRRDMLRVALGGLTALVYPESVIAQLEGIRREASQEEGLERFVHEALHNPHEVGAAYCTTESGRHFWAGFQEGNAASIGSGISPLYEKSEKVTHIQDVHTHPLEIAVGVGFSLEHLEKVRQRTNGTAIPTFPPSAFLKYQQHYAGDLLSVLAKSIEIGIPVSGTVVDPNGFWEYAPDFSQPIPDSYKRIRTGKKFRDDAIGKFIAEYNREITRVNSLINMFAQRSFRESLPDADVEELHAAYRSVGFTTQFRPHRGQKGL